MSALPPDEAGGPLRPLSTADPNYQRREEREDGHGAEMEPNARVWKVYVDETDKADKELVEGWNRAMDVMLSECGVLLQGCIFSKQLGFIPVLAALYSAILTAFVIESAKDLKPDYAELSARALLTISNSLLSPTSTSPDNESSASQADPPGFAPTRTAVVVNTLWFLALGLSISVTLIAILAKEWCYSFITRRTGANLTQGRLRQKRWDGIKWWKMEVIITMLPLLMHISLLLFAIGLSIYLWDINPRVAIPVIVTTVVTVLYYGTTAFLSLVYKYCPYKTAIVKLLNPLWVAIFKSGYTKSLFNMLIMAPARIIIFFLDIKNHDFGIGRGGTDPGNNPPPPSDPSSYIPQSGIHGFFHKLEARFHNWIEEMHKDFDVDTSKSSEDETPMDEATSGMLLWVINNCEDPKSVELALRALAGADLWLPCKPFLRKEIDSRILQKLERCIYVLESPHLGGHGSTWEGLLDNAYLYSRALATLLRGDPNQSVSPKVSWHEWEDCMKRIHKILETHPGGKSRQSQSGTGYEFGTLLLEGSERLHKSSNDFYTQQHNGQWQLLKQISANQVSERPPSVTSVRVLVNVITRTLLYECRSPLPLVELFNAYGINPVKQVASLGHSIGIALTIRRFTDTRYAPVPVENNQPLSSQANSTHSGAGPSPAEHGQMVYNKLSTKQPKQRRTRALLTFGLLGLLDLPNDQNYHNHDEIKAIENALKTLETVPHDPRDSTILAEEDLYLRHLGYHKLMPQTPSTFDLETQFNDIATNWLKFWVGPDSAPGQYQPASPKPHEAIVAMHLEALLSPSRCRLFGSVIVDRLMAVIFPPTERRPPLTPAHPKRRSSTLSTVDRSLSVAARKLCIRSLAYSITDWPGCSRVQKLEMHSVMHRLVATNFYAKMRSMITDPATNRELIPYAMRFLWNFAATLINYFRHREHSPFSSSDYVRVASAIRHHPRGTEIDGSGWTCVRGMGFEKGWFGLLRELCEENAQNVLDSGILGELTKECKDKCYQDTDSQLPETVLESLSSPTSHDEVRGTLPRKPWPEVYGHLKERCETSIAPRLSVISEVKETEVATDQPMVTPQKSESEQFTGVIE
ncbi:hypothetical protein FRC11_006874 [Ceratobasidium sp. 423]|nr:hypothetical protein FRC11_006874 [Ceratobasidium sp. 423]